LIGPYFPTMALPIFLAIVMIDDDVLEASRDLGAGWSYTMRHVVLPLSMPGIAAGIVFTFVPMLGEDVVPTLLGGGHVQLIGASVYSLLTVLNYSVAAAMSVVVLAIMAAVAGLLRLLLPGGGGLSAVFAALER
jgi:spermidine/putrescine transport system permease protein